MKFINNQPNLTDFVIAEWSISTFIAASDMLDLICTCLTAMCLLIDSVF